MRPQRAHHRFGGARVLARELRGEPCPTFRRRAPRHGCQPCFRGSRLPSRVPSALSPSGPASAAHTLDQDSPANGNVSRAGDECGVYRRFRVRGDDGTTTALLPDRARRGLLPFREEQEVSPPSPGRGSDGWTAAPSRLAGESLRGAHEPSLSHTPLAPVLHQVKVKGSYQPGGQGRRADGLISLQVTPEE